MAHFRFDADQECQAQAIEAAADLLDGQLRAEFGVFALADNSSEAVIARSIVVYDGITTLMARVRTKREAALG